MTLDETLNALRRLALIGLSRHDDQAVRAVAERIIEHIEGDEVATLDEALGIAPGPSEAHWKTIRARTERNAYLRLAAERFFPALSPRHAARALHEAARAYVAVAWSRDRDAFDCPAWLRGSVEEFIWAALRAWPSVLGAKAIEAVLSEEKFPQHVFPPQSNGKERG